jgi:3-oxoacyl-[acyl-carrier-protein] synthase-1
VPLESNEAIYSLIMMKNDFIAAPSNIDELDPAARRASHILTEKNKKIKTIMSNSFGFGGTNAKFNFFN